MANTIITKNSATATAVPTSGELVQGELAVNVTDKRIFTENSGGTVVELGVNPSSVTTGGLTVEGSGGAVALEIKGNNGTQSNTTLRFTDTDPTSGTGQEIGKIEFYSTDSSAVVADIRALGADASPDATFLFRTAEGTTLANRLRIENTGDISFYEDTGTTPKFVWDSSAESLGIGTSSPTATLNVVANTTSDAVRITQTGTGNAFVVEDDTSPDSSPFVIDATGRVLNGSTTSVSADDAGGTGRTAWAFQANSTSVPSGGYLASYWADNTAGAGGLSLAKSRGAAVGTRAIVQSGDELGQIGFVGDDGTNFISAAGIFAYVDGTPGTDDMPGRLVFSTTADGASSPTEAMRITSEGRLLINQTIVPAGAVPSPYGTGTAGNGGSALQVLTGGGIGLNHWAANAQGNGVVFNKSRTATPNSGTVTNSGDNLGYLLFNADDGANFIKAALIVGEADAASSTNSAPGRLVFSTTAAGNTNPSERVRIDADGLKFNGDTATTNALNDYEEGTWDPTYEPNFGAFTSVTYDFQTGHYTKVGRLVTCTFMLRTDGITVGTASGAVRVGNLPFTSISAAARILSLSYANAFAGEAPAAGYASGAGNDVILVYRITPDGNFSNSLQVPDLGTSTNDNYIIGSIIYYAD